MFTGIIENLGTIASINEIDGGRLITFDTDSAYLDELKRGDSVALNGVCLTVTAIEDGKFSVFAQIETISKTSLGLWEKGDSVNIELPMRLNDRLGGHLVQGHVDCVIECLDVDYLEDGSRLVKFDLPKEISKYVVDRGSICLNGVSLTVAKREQECFYVAFIPITIEKTVFGKLNAGDKVNVEVDSIARYVEQMLNINNE